MLVFELYVWTDTENEFLKWNSNAKTGWMVMLKLASKQRPDGSSSEGLDGKTLDKGTLMQ